MKSRLFSAEFELFQRQKRQIDELNKLFAEAERELQQVRTEKARRNVSFQNFVSFSRNVKNSTRKIRWKCRRVFPPIEKRKFSFSSGESRQNQRTRKIFGRGESNFDRLETRNLPGKFSPSEQNFPRRKSDFSLQIQISFEEKFQVWFFSARKFLFVSTSFVFRIFKNNWTPPIK